MSKNNPVTLVCLLAVLTSPVAYSQGTPDGETPAQEDVCEGLIGFTPGLYGLCVAFCEAQDCGAILDPATGEVTYDPGCNPSDPRLLRNYERLMTPDDPPMPCLKDPCPCWTEAELDLIADGETGGCGTDFDPPLPWALFGYDAADPNFHEDAFSISDEGFLACLYSEYASFRFFVISPEQLESCNISLAAECDSRGL